jgi:hypothetical protein
MKPTTQLVTLENGVKFGTLMVSVLSLYFAIKSDIRELYTEKHYEVEHLQYQIEELKDCCDKKSKPKNIAYKVKDAVLPSETKIESIF